MVEDFRLRVFAAVAASGSFTRAAAALGVTQPAVSQNIALLEKELGVSLFTRGKGAVTLTAEGRVLHEYARQILSSYEAIDGLFGARRVRPVDAPVRIVATEFVARHLLPGVLAKVRLMSSAEFVVETCPEADFPEGAPSGADLRLYAETAGEETLQLRLKLHFKASEAFSGLSVCTLLRRALEESLQNGIFTELVVES